MKIKVSEATGVVLDWLVAKCENKNAALHDDGITRCVVIVAASGVYKGTYRPSTNWCFAGPIIEREFIGVNPRADRTLEECWSAQFYEGVKNDLYVNEYGPTSLIAAMRCYCATRLGNEVEVPDEIL